MSVTYGFYDSLKHDRKYYAIQMSSIFDGIIRDGIFMSIGECMVVKATGEDMFVRVGEGRAWFDHTWTLNDSQLPLEVPQSELILNRIDAVVLEVNSDRAVRANSIKIVKGTPSSNPVRPTMIQTASIHQYPLAFIAVNTGVTSIRQADITNMVGSASTPYVTGILETVNIESMVAQWEDQWKKLLAEWEKTLNDKDQEFDDTIAGWTAEFDAWAREKAAEMMQTKTEWDNTWLEWFNQYTSSNSEAFTTWFENLQAMLEPDVAANLANEILKLQNRSDKLEAFRKDLLKDHAIYDSLQDRTKDPILDSAGREILGRTIFLTAGDAGVGGTTNNFIYPQSYDEYYEMMDKVCTNPYQSLWLKNTIMGGRKLTAPLSSEILQGIKDGTFKGLFVGDYFEIDGIALILAEFNTFNNIIFLAFENPTTAMAHDPDGTIQGSAIDYRTTKVYTYIHDTLGPKIDSVLSKIGLHRLVFQKQIFLNPPGSTLWQESNIAEIRSADVFGRSIQYYGYKINTRQLSFAKLTQGMHRWPVIPSIGRIWVNEGFSDIYKDSIEERSWNVSYEKTPDHLLVITTGKQDIVGGVMAIIQAAVS